MSSNVESGKRSLALSIEPASSSTAAATGNDNAWLGRKVSRKDMPLVTLLQTMHKKRELSFPKSLWSIILDYAKPHPAHGLLNAAKEADTKGTFLRHNFGAGYKYCPPYEEYPQIDALDLTTVLDYIKAVVRDRQFQLNPANYVQEWANHTRSDNERKALEFVQNYIKD